MKIRIVVVEDETLTRRAIAQLLRNEDWEVFEASDAFACDVVLRENPIDVAIIDLGLPGKGGGELIGELARKQHIAVIAVTAQNDPDNRIKILELGADDYVVKPYHGGELVARIRAVLRRRRLQISPRVKIGSWEIDLDASSARKRSGLPNLGMTSISLTRGEVSILTLLCEADGRIVSRERLSKAAARPSHDGELRTVDTLISRLRRKLQCAENDAAQGIVTVPGLGYRLVATKP